MSYIDDSVTLLQSSAFEGTIPWMYLDSRGNPTVAVGQLLTTLAAALALPFMSPDGGAADGDEIEADYNRVKAMSAGLSANRYRVESSPIMRAADISALLRTRVVEFDSQLRGFYPNFDSFPDGVKLALLDMIFNLGLGGLEKYTNMNASIKRLDFSSAANQCYRHGPDQERNNWTKNQFLEAA